jgi:hypothetical protein
MLKVGVIYGTAWGVVVLTDTCFRKVYDEMMIVAGVQGTLLAGRVPGWHTVGVPCLDVHALPDAAHLPGSC